MQFKKHSPIPVIEALRVLIRRNGLARVAYDFNLCESYVEAIAYGKKSMPLYVAEKLGFERVITWRPVDKNSPKELSQKVLSS